MGTYSSWYCCQVCSTVLQYHFIQFVTGRYALRSWRNSDFVILKNYCDTYGKKRLSSQLSLKNYYYLTKIPIKFIQIWLSKYYFVNLLPDAWQMLRYVNVTWPVMHYTPNWMKCYSTVLIQSIRQALWCMMHLMKIWFRHVVELGVTWPKFLSGSWILKKISW